MYQAGQVLPYANTAFNHAHMGVSVRHDVHGYMYNTIVLPGYTL